MLVRLLELGEKPPNRGQVVLGSRGAGVRDTEDAAKAPRCVLEEPLGKDELVTRGIGALHDRNHVRMSQPETYASSLIKLRRFEEAKSLLRKTMPVARRIIRDTDIMTLKLRLCYVHALHTDPAATLDDIREAVTTLEDVERIARRVFGSAHPITMIAERELRYWRAALRARETPGVA